MKSKDVRLGKSYQLKNSFVVIVQKEWVNFKREHCGFFVSVKSGSAELRAGRKSKLQSPAICATIRAKILKLYCEIQDARKEQHELFSNFGKMEGWIE